MYAKYTIALVDLMENEQAMSKIEQALSTYPLYEKKSKEEYIPSYIPTRSELNKKLLNHYKYREIGFETFGRFLDELEIAMNEIMPKYNLLFFTADQDFNILYNADYTRKIEIQRAGEKSENSSQVSSGEVTGTESGNNTTSNSGETLTTASDEGTTTGDSTNSSKNVHSATPQSELAITANSIDSVSYADDVTWKKDNKTDDVTTSSESSGSTEFENSSNTTTSSSNNSKSEGTVENSGSETTTGTEDSLETVRGNYGMVSSQNLVKAYRETIINVEQMIMEDNRIRDLFMTVY